MDDLKAYVDGRLKQIEQAQKELAKQQADLAAKADAVARAEAELKAQAAANEQAAQRTQASADAKTTQPVRTAGATPAALETDQNGNLLGILSKPVMLYDDNTTSVHFFGLVEATLSDATNQNKKGSQAIGFQTAWFSGNRWGFDIDHALKFGENIGMPDLKIISKLEGEYEVANGGFDTNNTIFNRDAWVGFHADKMGKLTFGRQNTLTRDFTQTWGDAYGTQGVTLKEGGYTNVNNFKQFIFYSADPGGTRNDSSIVWKKKFGEHIVAGAAYGFSYKGNGGSADPGVGGGLPGQFSNGSSEAVSLAYNRLEIGGGALSFNVNYDRANNDNLIHQAELIGGNYVIGMLRVNAGYVHYTAQQGDHNSAGTRTDNSWTASVVVTPVKSTDIALGYVDMAGHNAGFSAGGVTLLPFLQDTRSVTTTANGSKGTLFGSVMYHADKQTDFYIASDYMKIHGGWHVNDAQGNNGPFGRGLAHSDEVEVATGVRFKF
ncbi:MAG: porin [Telmatospirillum sp.]|nr:porin [Telmatospirillum sp.]